MEQQKLYRIVAFYGGRESVVARNLTEEEARDKLAFYQAKPFGMQYCIEAEQAAAQWQKTLAKMSIPHPVR
jgi:hypothetical protein